MKFSALTVVFKLLTKWYDKERNKFTVGGNHEYKETSKNS